MPNEFSHIVPNEVYNLIQDCANTCFGEKVTGLVEVGGGCINHTFKVSCQTVSFFVKWNAKKAFPTMFQKERQGLEALAITGSISTPQICGLFESEEYSLLALEWIDQGRVSLSFWQQFGAQLAQLHQSTGPSFGHDDWNYIGALRQHNNCHERWSDFFIEERLIPQYELARKNGFGQQVSGNIERLAKEVESIFPDEKPALLHGDLWSGNFIVMKDGAPCLIDPAVYFGHREVDLAFTQLFGGFSPEFYQFYEEQFPLQQGFQNRIPIYNLYPLLVHVNLFGGGYWSQVESIVSKF